MDGSWPSDILTEILLKLPVKSIIRFKCVAQTWCHLFRNPRFISQHLSISKKNKRLVVYHLTGNNDNFVMRLFVHQALVFYHDLHLPSHFASIDFLEFYVDNGLFCLHDPQNSVLALWNPATREFKILPECNQNIRPNESTYFVGTLGFGLDPLSNDYKVVYIQKYLDSQTDIEEPAHYAIYSMSSGSWREFKDEDVEFLRDYEVCGNNNNACLNGVYYWHTYKYINSSFNFVFKVLAFDLSTEVFQLIDSPFPERCGHLLPLHDRIAIWDTDSVVDMEISNEVWVLNDDGRHWAKVLKIEIAVLQVHKMFGFWKNGKVLVESVTGQLVLYDLEKEEAKEVCIHNREGGNLLFVHTYEESLIAIGNE